MPVFGPLISGIGVDFGKYSDSADRVLRTGLANRDSDRLLEHSTSDDGMLAVALDQVGDGLVFTLPNEHEIESIVVWNYNKPAYTDLGIQEMDVSIWTEKDGWKTILKDTILQEAEGSDDYDDPTVITFKPVLAEKVRFGNLTTFDPKAKQVGLSEVRFHGPLGPAASNPEPRDGSQVSYCKAVPLAWAAGRNAVVHDVYVGDNKESLQFLGRIKGLPEVKVSGLPADKAYLWRVDEVTKDGTVTMGQIWSFTTKGALVGYWPLDEGLQDLAGGRSGTISGERVWEAGHDGKALKFDGGSDYVEIPDDPSLNPTGGITVSAWIKADTWQPDFWQGSIVSKDEWDGGHGGYCLRCGQDGRLSFVLGIEAGWPEAVTDPFMSTGTWYHVAGTYDGSTIKVYINGSETASKPQSGTINPSGYPLNIGRGTHDNTRIFDGLIDEVKIFNFALSASQIEQVRQGEKIDLIDEGTMQLVDADFVEEGRSLEEVAAEQQERTGQQKRNNLVPVVIIIAVILVIAVLSRFKKKK